MESELNSLLFRSLRGSFTGLTTRWRTAVPPPVRALSFWLAIGLPWVLLALTLSGGVSQQPMLFAGLLMMTLLCALVGHDYRR